LRVFLYTYDEPKHFNISRRFGLLGVRSDDTGIDRKVQRIRREDLVVLRDASRKAAALFLGAGKVVGEVYDQRRDSPFREFIWPDEQFYKKLIYPWRIPVDFKMGPQLERPEVEWSELGALGLLNEKGEILANQQQWGKKLCGNFLDEAEAAKFLTLLSDAL
jgi:hypothetical protein